MLLTMPNKIGIFSINTYEKEMRNMLCGKCGTELIDGICPKCAQNGSKNSDDYERKIKKFFMSQNEKMVAVLGKGYSEEYLKKGKCLGGFAVVSDKRLYSFGRSYEICSNVFGRKAPRENKQSKTIDLKDVTRTGDGIYRQSRWIVMGIIHLILMIIGLITCIIIGGQQNEDLAWLFVFSLLMIPVLFIFMIIYFIVNLTTKFHMLTVQYSGGEIAFDMADFTAEEIALFQRKLRFAKDKATENNHNIEESTIKDAVSSVIQSTSYGSKADELVKLADLLAKGVISQEEFEKMKRELIL